MVFWESLIWAVEKCFVDGSGEVVAAKIVWSGMGKLGLFGEVGVSLGPECQNGAPDDVYETLYPAIGGLIRKFSFGADAECLCPFLGEAAVEGMGPAEGGLRGVCVLDGSQRLGCQLGLVVRVR